MTGALLTLAAAGDAFYVTASGSANGNCGAMAPAGCTATTNSVTQNTVGGVFPYTRSWEHVSGDTFNVNSPTSGTTSFSRTASTTGSPSFNGTYRGKTVDALGRERYTAPFSVSTSHSDTT